MRSTLTLITPRGETKDDLSRCTTLQIILRLRKITRLVRFRFHRIFLRGIIVGRLTGFEFPPLPRSPIPNTRHSSNCVARERAARFEWYRRLGYSGRVDVAEERGGGAGQVYDNLSRLVKQHAKTTTALRTYSHHVNGMFYGYGFTERV